MFLQFVFVAFCARLWLLFRHLRFPVVGDTKVLLCSTLKIASGVLCKGVVQGVVQVLCKDFWVTQASCKGCAKHFLDKQSVR